MDVPAPVIVIVGLALLTLVAIIVAPSRRVRSERPLPADVETMVLLGESPDEIEAATEPHPRGQLRARRRPPPANRRPRRIPGANLRRPPAGSVGPPSRPRSACVETAVIFPGQGTQQPGMGVPWRDHAAWSVVERAEAALGEPLADLLLDAPAEQLARTREAQLAVLLTSLVAWEAARDHVAAPGRVRRSLARPGHRAHRRRGDDARGRRALRGAAAPS